MNDLQYKITTFHKKFGYDIRESPEIPSKATMFFREKLMREELNELVDSMYRENLVLIADGIADVLYTVIGTAITYGIDIEKVFNEVHRSNMSKDVSNDSVKKAIKGDNYSRPNLKKVIEELNK